MVTTEHIEISPDAARPVVLRHEQPAKIGLPRHRITSLGVAPNGEVYVFLGSKLQVSEYVETRRSLRGEDGPLPNSGDIFRFGDKMLGDHLLDGAVKERTIESLRKDIADGDALVGGPILARSDPAKSPVILREAGGVYAPVRIAAEQGWLLALD